MKICGQILYLNHKLKEITMAEKIFAEAINEAIADEMRRDSNVFIMG